MKNVALLPPASGRMLLVPVFAVALTASSFAQQSPYSYSTPPPGYGYPPQRPGVGERVGGFVRRLFYGETGASYRQPPQYGYPTGRSLDSQPTGASRYAPPPPSYSQPPASTPAKTSSTPPASKPTPSKPAVTKSSSSSSKYTPPKIKPDAPPAPKPSPKSTQPDTPPIPPKPETKPEPKIEQTPPAPQLDNTPTPPPTTLASVSKSLPDLEIPTIKQPEAPATPSPSTTTTTTADTPKESPPPPAADPSSGQFLVGKKTAVPGRVVSPYPPYQELDVSGLASGSLALDPTTDKVFEIP